MTTSLASTPTALAPLPGPDASGRPIGPGGQATGWTRLARPAFAPAGTWVAHRWNTTTGGVVNQLGTRGDFGPEEAVRVGWQRSIDLQVGVNLLRVRFAMGPVSELPHGAAARARVYARLHPTFDVGFYRPPSAYADLPAGGTVELPLQLSIPGRWVIEIGTINEIRATPGATPYCETIVRDLRVEHVHWPLPQLAATGQEPAADGADGNALDLASLGDDWVTAEA